MAVTPEDFLELTGDGTGSPSTAGFSLRSAKAAGKWYVEAGKITSADDLQEAITLLVGGTDQAVGDGRLARFPPMAHPTFPWLYVSNIPTIQGIGLGTLKPSAADINVPNLPSYYLWSQYVFSLEFAPLPYPPLPDENITVTTGTYYDASGKPVIFQKTNEYLRYTDYTLNGKEEAITATQGRLVFRTQSKGQPNQLSFSGLPKVFLRNQLVKFTWYAVPWRLLTSENSFFPQFVGQINQVPFYELPAGGYQWDIGELLYLGYEPKRFSPPTPEEDQWSPGVYSSDKLMDIELTFLQTQRFGADLPNPAVIAAANKNFIAAGHNLMPWIAGNGPTNIPGAFYYVTAADPKKNMPVPAQQFPIWQSFDPAILFTDCDF